MESLEGFLSHFVARDSLARSIAKGEERNTDDQTLIEFGFARGLGSEDARFDMDELTALARNRHEDRPALVRGAINWETWAANRAR